MRVTTLFQALVPSLVLSMGSAACVIYTTPQQQGPQQPSSPEPQAPAPAATQNPDSTAQQPAPATTAKPTLKAVGTPLKQVGRRIPRIVAAPDGKIIEVDGKPVPVVSKTVPFGGSDSGNGALLGLVYFLADETSKLPNFDEYLPSGALFAKELNVSPREFTEGFPGVDPRSEWFAIRYVGQFSTKVAGDYDFRLVSDDGATLRVDNVPLIDNDGLHEATEKRGKIRLMPGQHSIELHYFQGARPNVALQLFVTPPNGKEVLWSPSL